MRKCLLVIGLLMVIAAQSQDKYTTYDNSYTGKSYEIQISVKEAGYTLYINAMSLDKLYEIGGIMIKEKQMEDFREMLVQAGIKYSQWKEVAISNKVKDLSKPMDLSCRAGGYWQSTDSWKFQYVLTLQCYFRIIEKEDIVGYYLLITTGKMKASDNEYMDMAGVGLVFASSDEIEDFFQKVSQESIEKFINAPKSDDLFK